MLFEELEQSAGLKMSLQSKETPTTYIEVAENDTSAGYVKGGV